MIPVLTALQYRMAYRLWLQFADGAQGEIDLEAELWGEVFAPPRDPAYFKTVQFDKELNTISWANGADCAPEFLYALVTTGLKAPTQT